MPLPIVPVAAFALRAGAVAGLVWLARRAIVRPGRTDQRAEDALDDLGEGLSLHRPADRASADTRQTNAAARVRRTLTWSGGGVEIDAAWLGRLRIRKV
ncbi:hypothetical protein LV780_14005 [Cereibacter azotoformans]|uniref:Uncharacterized protein n=1 Tax=Cereibacter azotoformans TaxID=43057 RepID=A0A2T5K8M8_9RHOB|nr:hypothetical protein [Cereibacter azotoformans]AXQ94818.1 hypothetical protein D0Z66_14025 [Cereibacter sphaeroides]MBO4170318.1 hypothetical protein [Cereibacter azotoformans]PTR18775.1 hypothetical protein C8J28_107201 [Cereibacter azotoformans]UIJ30390.1 hypothetical protein LV780_14005 [Cereibacter azotoformans]